MKTLLNKIQWEYIVLIIALIVPRWFYYGLVDLAFIKGDSIDYLGYAYLFSKGEVPDLGIIPPLYPILMSFIKDISQILLLQSIAFSVVSISLLRSLRKHYKSSNKVLYYSIFVALVLFVSDGMMIRFETIIQTESIFAILLVLYVKFVVEYTNTKSILSLTLLGVLSFLLAFARTNGLLFYPMFAVVLTWSFLTQKDQWLKRLSIAVIPFVLLNIGWCFLNYASTETFFFGNPYRLKLATSENLLDKPMEYSVQIEYNDEGHLIVPYNKQEKEPYLYYSYSKNIKSKPKLILNYLWEIGVDRASFYNEMLPSRLSYFYEPNIFSDSSTYQEKFVKYKEDGPAIREYIFNQVDDLEVVQESITILSGLSKTFNILNGVQNLLSRSIIWHLISILLFIYASFNAIKMKSFLNKDYFRIVLLFMTVYGNLLAVSVFHVRLVARYQYIFIFINILLALDLLFYVLHLSKQKQVS